MDDVVSHEEHDNRGSFFIERDGVRIAEMAYRRNGETSIRIDHTEVQLSLRGQGIAGRLFEAAVAWARQTGTRMTPHCSYAKVRFHRDKSLQDVLG